MSFRATTAAVLLALNVAAVCAQSDTASFRDGRFAAILAFTDRADEFLAQWNKPAQRGYRPQLHSTRRVSLHKPVTGFVFFGNCPATPRCLLKANFLITKADGTVVEQKKDVPIWTQEQSPPENAMVLGEARFTVTFDKPDEVGQYQITVTLVEASTGKRGILSVPLEVTE
jgi:hypothetical protein